MKSDIHPKFFPNATVTCSCGNTWHTGSTKEVIHTDMCGQCHPFYTGEQRLVDTEGQVDRFYKKLQTRDAFRAQQAEREATKVTTPDQPVASLELGARPEAALTGAGLLTVADVLDRLEAQGEEAFLTIEGFGRKSLIDLKKRLRARGFLAESATEPETETAPAAE